MARNKRPAGRRKSKQPAKATTRSKTAAPAPAPTQLGDNRRDTIRLTCRELLNLERARDAVATKIRELLQTNIKGELGMKIADFRLAYRLYKLEGPDRKEFLDTFQETFRALRVGQQMDFLEEIRKADEAAEQKARDHAEQLVREQGNGSDEDPIDPASPGDDLRPPHLRQREADRKAGGVGEPVARD